MENLSAETPILQIQQVSCSYGTTEILHDVNLDLQKHEIVAIVGRNGVGKSTLMKAVIGLLSVTRGNIRLEGSDVTRLPTHTRAQKGMGYIPQGRGVFPRLSVEENLRIGQSINRNIGSKPLDIAYEYFPRLHERRKQNAGSLSGGEQSMLAIGRVLVGQPRVLVLDEPSEGIQPNLRQKIGEDIIRINTELGVPVLIVEQNIELIQAVAQRGYVMEKGRITLNLKMEEIQDQDFMTKYLAV